MLLQLGSSQNRHGEYRQNLPGQQSQDHMVDQRKHSVPNRRRTVGPTTVHIDRVASQSSQDVSAPQATGQRKNSFESQTQLTRIEHQQALNATGAQIQAMILD